MSITSVSTTGTIHPTSITDEVTAAAQRALVAHFEWRTTPLEVRSRVLRKLAHLLEEGASSFAELMASEMGKPVRQGRAEIQKCAWVCRYYADNGPMFLRDVAIPTDNRKTYVTHEPLGVVLAIMPWNFPFWQVFRCAAPTVLAGNSMLLKHASNVPGCANALETLFRQAGTPAGVLQRIYADHHSVTALIMDSAVSAVTFTGTTGAGRKIGAQAGHALKKAVLELGGSDAYVLLDDVDVEQAAEICVTSRLINAGQSCIAAKRFVVTEKNREDFEELVIAKMRSVEMGDPLDEATELGPLARVDLRDKVHDQVRRSIDKGARLRLGGRIPDRRGAWYPATVLTDVEPGMPAFDEEVFGPVAAISVASSDANAIRLANSTSYGLGAAVFTRNVERGEQIARDELVAGSCFVNAMVASDPRLPFGGVRESGFGRELAMFGIKEFVNIKTVVVARE